MVGQKTVQSVFAYEITRRVALPFMTILAPDINVVMDHPDAGIELSLDAPLFQADRQILNLLRP